MNFLEFDGIFNIYVILSNFFTEIMKIPQDLVRSTVYMRVVAPTLPSTSFFNRRFSLFDASQQVLFSVLTSAFVVSPAAQGLTGPRKATTVQLKQVFQQWNVHSFSCNLLRLRAE